MTTAQLTDQELAEISAGETLTAAHAHHLVTLRTSVIARLLHQDLPAAARIVVDVGGWYYPEFPAQDGGGSVRLLAVLDSRGSTPLWAEHAAAGAGTPTRWRAVVEAQLLAALRHSTPEDNGWPAFQPDDADLTALPDNCVHVVPLAVPQPSTGHARA